MKHKRSSPLQNNPITIRGSDQILQQRERPVPFVELMARSNFSFLQGASHPEEMVEQAVRLKYQGISICDLNGLYGSVRGYQAAKNPSLFTASIEVDTHFKYFSGTEFVLTNEQVCILTPLNKEGYFNLCQLITIGKRNAEKGFCRLDISDIQNYRENLLCYLIYPSTETSYLEFSKIFEDRLYIPVWRDLTWSSQEAQAWAFNMEQKYSAQLFVTNRAFMHSSHRRPLFDTLTCILHHTTLEKAKSILPSNGERYLRPLEDLCWLWQDRLDLVLATNEIAERIQFSFNEITYRYPESQIPKGHTISSYLKDLTINGLAKRFPQGIPHKILDLAEHELKLISELQYEDYFLTLYEICQFATAQKILYQGRGSAANSVVCYAIGLTNVNPTQIEVLFERFISKERGEPPDIDIDFEHERREEVIQHIYQKYDEHHAAMVCTVIRYRARLSLREVAKVLDIPLTTVNKLIKFIGRDGLVRLKSEPNVHEKFEIPLPTWNLYLALASELRGFPRHLGIHSGGFLISHQPITQMVPVEKATMNGRYVIQWNKDDINNLKLMKIDILSLGMLTALRKALELLSKHKNIHWDLSQIPKEDPDTYDMICRAETVGVFQIESRAQMNTLPRLKPRTFYDLVVEVALVRPGPLQGGMVHPYLRRRQGLEKTTYAHPCLEPILKKTMGVPIFQEQVMKIAVTAAGFSPGEADELRRIMTSAWKQKNTMEGVRTRILSGLQKNGISLQYAEQIYQTIQGFANYGFPESHAASFALLTYASCYLKRHHPDVFVCSLLNSQPLGFYPPRTLIQEAQKNGVHFRSLDIQTSEYDYTIEADQCVRVGLRSIFGAPKDMLLNILKERIQNGRFISLQDFIRRTQIPKVILMKLAASGAFIELEPDVRKTLWTIEGTSLDRQSFLWGNFEHVKQLENIEDLLPIETKWDAMNREYQRMGFSIDKHPISVLRPQIENINNFFSQKKWVPYMSSKDLSSKKHKDKIRVCGLVGITQRPPTAKGMCFITLEDEFGFMNIIIPPLVYEKDRATIYTASLLEIQGHLERTGSILNIKAARVLPLQLKPNYGLTTSERKNIGLVLNSSSEAFNKTTS